MLVSIPDYYYEFSCIADRCEDTCCAGWQIVVDQASLKRYLKEPTPYKWRLISAINWKEGCFRQSEDHRCSFLKEDNFCEMYERLGKKSLCKTCKNYPRHIEDFDNIREITLSLSCPEVARILLSKKEPVSFLTAENEKEEEYEDFDLLFYSVLSKTREKLLFFAQDRSLPFTQRCAMIYAICQDLQRKINQRALFSCDEIYEKYQRQEAISFVKEKSEAFLKDLNQRRRTAYRLFQKLYLFEHLRKDFEHYLLETEILVYRKSLKEYQTGIRGFEAWKSRQPEWEIWMEQILVYFLSTYFCGAVYDGQAFAKAMMALVSLSYLHDFAMARWLKNDRELKLEDLVEVVYRYSREIEHSDPNLNLLEHIRFETDNDRRKDG